MLKAIINKFQTYEYVYISKNKASLLNFCMENAHILVTDQDTDLKI